ncbi:MAG: SsrA-binding protein SmpB [Prosthecochloris sp.]|uniref:SsrA-binding protein n=1 Tax=Prosthecochloris aestuarii (strain DSM 271 / SK 413) TaxID=290512 RepID=B4S6J9_PROA2|nr:MULTISPECIES: SsrA-binding protein SmpB [Prosthecochloris]ACF45754.1 SsrA-binding protein [Prosthecochloris aestuarii DSM 271]MCW8798734.1 SsrA-binding protein SmpB [Prosthecochloris sp.]NEX12132.1 SsrA-binding protein SmpB [Prosthecochloris sp.]RDD30728.1 SsrA-binding protein SmpB [Prosthecochloris sp. ZM]
MAKQQQKPQYVSTILNRKARHEFTILETVVAGIELQGSEVKSIRLGRASLNESYAIIHRGEVWLENMQITPYEHNTLELPDPKRSRKLLLQKSEIIKIQSKLHEKGLTLIPLKAFFNSRGMLKIELGIAKGKKLFDKRESIKNRDAERQLQRLKHQY